MVSGDGAENWQRLCWRNRNCSLSDQTSAMWFVSCLTGLACAHWQCLSTWMWFPSLSAKQQHLGDRMGEVCWRLGVFWSMCRIPCKHPRKPGLKYSQTSQRCYIGIQLKLGCKKVPNWSVSKRLWLHRAATCLMFEIQLFHVFSLALVWLSTVLVLGHFWNH